MTKQPTTPETQAVETQELRLPIMEKDLPPIIRPIVCNAPTCRKVPSFIACLAPLCALATRVRLRYHYDGERPSALLLHVIIEGQQSAGKSFASDIEKLLMNDTLKARDKMQRRMEQEYREKKKRRKANEKLEEEPQTTIRVIPATISKTVLVKRSDLYERILGDVLTFWMFADELAQVTDAGKQGFSNLRTIMRSAWDLGSLFGLDFASDNSYSAIVDINICSMFCATPSAVDRYMDNDSIEGGNITRTILCQLNDELGAEGAIFQPYSNEQRSEISSTLKLIMDDTYDTDGNLKPAMVLDTSWIDNDVVHWCRNKGKEALLSGSKAIDIFRKRASASAFRTMVLCYYLYRKEGTNEATAQRRCRKIYRWMADYTLDMLMKRWGKRFEQLQAKRYAGEVEGQSGRTRLIDRLDKEFTREQLRNLMAEAKVCSPDKVFISQWKANRWIEETDKNKYRKLI